MNNIMETQHQTQNTQKQTEEIKRTSLSNDDILQYIKSDIDEAKGYFESQVYPQVKTRYDVYNASDEYYSNKMPRLHSKSKIVSTDVADVVEWIMPKLMHIFFNSDDVVSVTGRGEEDDKKAQVFQDLLNYQINVLNNGFMTFYRWFKDALITGIGVVKCYWERKYEYSDTYTEYLSEERIQEFEANPEVEIISKLDFYNADKSNNINKSKKEKQQNDSIDNIDSVDNIITSENASPITRIYEVKYKVKKIVKDRPVIENIPITEFLFDPTARDLDEAKYVIHKKQVTVDYLRQKAEAGIYKKDAVENAIENALEAEQDLYTVSYLVSNKTDYLTNNNNEYDTPRKKITLYECYEKLDINNDGKLEDVIITVAQDEILRIEENTYGRHPFFALTPHIEPYKVIGKGFADIIGQLQDLKTAILKELVINLALSNESKLLVREDAFYVEDFLNNRPFVRIRQNVPNIHNVIVPITPKPVHQLTMPMLEYIDFIRENRSGITRYSQGLDGRALNHTATGISMIMDASNQRLELIIRIFVETGIKSLFRFLVSINQKFVSQSFVIRLFNKQLEISPDDLQGDFDLVVNASITRGTPDQQMQAIQMMLQTTMQVLMPLGLADASKVYNLVKIMYEKLGYKNVDDFVVSPEQLQQQQQMMAMQQQQMGMIPSQQQQSPQQPPMPQQAPQGKPQAQQQQPNIDPQMLLQMLGGGVLQ